MSFQILLQLILTQISFNKYFLKRWLFLCSSMLSVIPLFHLLLIISSLPVGSTEWCSKNRLHIILKEIATSFTSFPIVKYLLSMHISLELYGWLFSLVLLCLLLHFFRFWEYFHITLCVKCYLDILIKFQI